MAIVSALSPISLAQFFYASGKLVRPARLFFYKPNTEDAVLVYTDPTLGVPYEQPVLTGGSGRVPPIYIGTEPYRIRIFDSYGAMVEDIEYLPGASSIAGDGGGEPGVPGQVLQTGDMFFSFATYTTQRTGCVRANGGLIGPVGFDATGYADQIERINDDTEALFTWLWGQDGAGALAIVPAKGSSAANDWAQKKAIRVPDLRGRALVGIDGMGLPLTGRLNGVAVTPNNPAAPGAYGGAATAILAVANMPLHTHTVAANITGITVLGNLTGITLAGSVASLNPATTGITSTQVGPTGIGIYGNSTGIYLTDAGHDHAYDVPIPFPGGGFQTFVGDWGMGTKRTGFNASGVALVDPWHIHAVYDPTHAHGISDPAHNHPQALHFHTLTDPIHTHATNDPLHAHNLSAEGGNVAVPTMSPFSLAVVYIKL